MALPLCGDDLVSNISMIRLEVGSGWISKTGSNAPSVSGREAWVYGWGDIQDGGREAIKDDFLFCRKLNTVEYQVCLIFLLQIRLN